MTPEELRAQKIRKRRLAKIRFKSLVRKVMVNRYWLNELEEQKFGDNVRRNIAIIVRRKGKKGILTIQDKTILNTQFIDRTIEQREKLVLLMASLKCFLRYPPKIRSRLAKCSYYQYFNAGRTILREGHHPNAIYFILDGEITISQMKWSTIDKMWQDEPINVLGPGEVFGEVALLQNIMRTATCTTAVDTELLCVYREDFNRILKDTLKLQWDQIKTSLTRFEYFKLWTEDQIQECCILSKIKQYSPLQTIYEQDIGKLNDVYFVLSGNCMILQCLKMNVKMENNLKLYELVEVEQIESASRELITKLHKSADDKRQLISPLESYSKCKSLTEIASSELKLTNLQSYPSEVNIPNLELSTVINKEEKIQFVDVGAFSCGSVFGLGEQMEQRTIVAKNVVQCLCIPRYWLFQKSQNLGNVWQRTKMYLDSSIPSRVRIFEDFKSTNKWEKYKKKLIQTCIEPLNSTKNHTTLTDVPIICRIDAGL